MSDLRVIVVGMNPGNSPRGRPGPSIRKLEEWMSLLNIYRYSFINASYVKGQCSKKDIAWDVLKLVNDYPKVISLGRFAAAALNEMKVKHFELPHPSPLNRLLNNFELEHKAITNCYSYLHYEN